MARGAYLRDLGNTPGHVNHWSKRSFASPLSRHGEVGGPLAVPVDDAARAGPAARRCVRARRPHPLDRHRDHRAGHVRVLRARQPQPQRGRLQGPLGPVVGAVPDHLDHLPAGRAAALAHDLVAPGAGARGPSAARAVAHPGDGGDASPWWSRSRCASRSPTTCSTARTSCTGSWSSPCSPTRPATSRAAGWPGTSASALRRPRAARVVLALPVRARGRDRDRLRPGRGRARHRRRPLVSLLVILWAIEHRGAEAATAGRCARARASPARCWRS